MMALISILGVFWGRRIALIIDRDKIKAHLLRHFNYILPFSIRTLAIFNPLFPLDAA